MLSKTTISLNNYLMSGLFAGSFSSIFSINFLISGEN